MMTMLKYEHLRTHNRVMQKKFDLDGFNRERRAKVLREFPYPPPDDCDDKPEGLDDASATDIFRKVGEYHNGAVTHR